MHVCVVTREEIATSKKPNRLGFRAFYGHLFNSIFLLERDFFLFFFFGSPRVLIYVRV